jgi:hypothetical protein
MVSNGAKMCIDDTTDAKLAAAYDPCDPPLYFAFYSPQFTKEGSVKLLSATPYRAPK